MILEIGVLKVRPELEAEFLKNVAEGVALFRRAKGCRGMEVRSSPEAPGEYRLLVLWETLDNHLVDFRNSPDLLEWRRLTVHCYAEPPDIKNWAVAVDGFGFAAGGVV